jgi:CBS-domain-containing membrane protein
VLYRGIGVGLAVAATEGLAALAGEPMSRVPLVTSIVLVLLQPDNEAARPAAIVAGHFGSAALGLLASCAFGYGHQTGAVAVALAAILMQRTGTVHPPAGLTAFMVAADPISPFWLVMPLATGVVSLAAFSSVWHALEERLFLGFRTSD